MAKTIVGLFDSFAEAQQVVQDLVDVGFRREDVSLVTNDNRTVNEFAHYPEIKERQGATRGAGTGALAGGVLGLLVGVGLLTIPGIGPVLAAGPLAGAAGSIAAAAGATVVGAGIGAAAGGLLGALIDLGVPEEEAHHYAEGVRRGGTLVAVTADEAMVGRAYDIMRRHSVVDIQQRGVAWREGGWERFDPEGEPYRGAGDAGDSWKESSKVGTAAGTLSGAATGAVIGAAGGPVGSVVGGIAGAITGAGVGAAGDVAGEQAQPAKDYRFVNDYYSSPSSGTQTGAPIESPQEQHGAGAPVPPPARELRDESELGEGSDYARGLRTERAVGAGPDYARGQDHDDAGAHGSGPNYARGQDHDDAGAHGPGSDYARGMRSFEEHDADFRSHHRSAFAGGEQYDYYNPGYRFGYELSRDSHYHSTWEAIEPDVRSRWEAEHPNSWDRFREVIRYAWEKGRGIR